MKKTNPKPKLSREMITAIGEKLRQSKDVNGVSVQVEFNDGSGMRFRKFDDED